MQQGHKWWRWGLAFVAVIWGIAPILSILPLLHKFANFRVSIYLWEIIAVAWAISFVLLFVGLFLMDMGNALISLICTVSFGLPAIALGPFPNLTQPPSSGATLDLNQVRLPRQATAEPVLYIVGIDVSQSFYPTQDLPIRDSLKRLFGDRGPVGAAMKSDLKSQVMDHFEIFSFSSGPMNPTFPDGVEYDLNNNQRAYFLRKLENTAFLRPPPTIDVKKTDVLGFIAAALGTLATGRRYCAVRLLIFSDFRQSLEKGQDLNKSLSDIQDMMVNAPNITLVAFHAPPSSSEQNEVDVLPRLRHILDPKRVTEIDLKSYQSAQTEAEQVMLTYNLIPFDEHVGRWDLASADAENPDKPRITVTLPRNYGTVFVGVFAEDDGDGSLTLGVPGCDGGVGQSETLSPVPGGASYCKLERNLASSEQVELEVGSRSHKAAQGILRLIVPERNQVLSAEVNVVADNSRKFKAFSLILLILNMVPMVIGIAILVSLVRESPRRPPQVVVLQQGS